MPLFGRRRPPRPLTGSAAGVTDPSINMLQASAMKMRRGDVDPSAGATRAWQQRAFFFYDNVGEIKFAAQFYARGLAGIELLVGKWVIGKSGRPEIEQTNDPAAVAALDRIQDPGGGRSVLLSAYGRLMFLTGEGNLIVYRDKETELESWEMLSTEELRMNPGGTGYQRVKAPSVQAEMYRQAGDDEWEPVDQNTAVVYRFWKRHPMHSLLPDSPMQAVLDTCEELMSLTQVVRARIRSRLAGAGILFIDGRISPPEPPDEDGPQPDEDPMLDPLVEKMIRAMTAPIKDEGEASAIVPLLIRVEMPEDEQDRKLSDMVYLLKIFEEAQLYPEFGMREKAVERLAIQLDMPPEVLTGLSQSNHWNAWMIDEQTWRGHLQPVAQQFCDDLSAHYLRPTLRADGVKDWQDYVVYYDASAVVTHPNRAADAKDVHDRGELSGEALREFTGFDEDHAPSEEDRRIWLSVKSRNPGFALGEEPSGAGQGQGQEEPDVDGGDDVTPEPPTPPDDQTTTTASANGSASTARLLGAADLAILRAREAAGNRLKSLAKRDQVALDLIRDVRRPGQIPAILGPDRVRALDAPPDRELVGAARPLIMDALATFGVTDEDVTARIAEAVERHAARTLYQPNPGQLPPSFLNYLEGLRGD